MNWEDETFKHSYHLERLLPKNTEAILFQKAAHSSRFIWTEHGRRVLNKSLPPAEPADIN